MTRSTLGFIFSADLTHVLLITKQKPIFHKGKLNGLGGKCEPRESYLNCIKREVKEESGLSMTDWIRVGELQWQNWQVAIFTSVYANAPTNAKSLTSDSIAWYPVDNLPPHMLTNLAWLIPLCLDILKTNQNIDVKIQYA